MVQLYKRFSDSQVEKLIQQYQRKEIERRYIQEVLGNEKRDFLRLSVRIATVRMSSEFLCLFSLG